MKTSNLFLFLIVTGLLSFGVAHAHDNHPACKEDAHKFCADVKPGKGRMMECLKAHADEISKECKKTLHDKMQKRDEMRGEMHEACKEDVQKNCADVKPGGGRILKCLKEHEAALSAACKEKLDEAHKRREGHK